MPDIDVNISESQPIQVTVGTSTPISATVNDSQPINVAVGQSQPINIAVKDAQPINVKLADVVQTIYYGSSSDKNYTAPFAPTSSLLVTHNLNKYPSVDIINSAGDEVIGSVNYIDLNSLLITFSAPFGGRLTCN